VYLNNTDINLSINKELIIKVVLEKLQNEFKTPTQQNAQCSSLDIYVITLYCYMFQCMRDHQGTGIKCQIFYKKLSTFYYVTILHHA